AVFAVQASAQDGLVAIPKLPELSRQLLGETQQQDTANSPHDTAAEDIRDHNTQDLETPNSESQAVVIASSVEKANPDLHEGHIEFSKSLLFAQNDTRLLVGEETHLAPIREALTSNKHWRAKIIGYAEDEYLRRMQARQLAMTRAFRLRKALIFEGIAPERLSVAIASGAQGAYSNAARILVISR
ncbi:MAG: OmpA family protein, partial [Pseudomonadota bacterium]